MALLYTCMSLNWYFNLDITGLPTDDVIGTPYDVTGGIPSPTIISFGTDTNICLFVYLFCHYSKLFFHTCTPIVFLVDGQLFFVTISRP